MTEENSPNQQTDNAQQPAPPNISGSTSEVLAQNFSINQPAQTTPNSDVDSIYPNPTSDTNSISNMTKESDNITKPTKKRPFEIIIFLIIVLLLGGAGYYFFIVRVTRKIDKVCLVTNKTNKMVQKKYYLTFKTLGKTYCEYKFSIDQSDISNKAELVQIDQYYLKTLTNYGSEGYQDKVKTGEASIKKDFTYNGYKGIVYQAKSIAFPSDDIIKLIYDHPYGVVTITAYEKSLSTNKLIKMLKTLDFEYGYQASKKLK